MKYEINLINGLNKTEQYNAFKFPGGEIHFKLEKSETVKIENSDIKINVRLNNSDDIFMLIQCIDAINRLSPKSIEVFIPYLQYQQADRVFSDGESFSLKIMTNILNSLPVNKYVIYDAHSDVSSALLNECLVIDNSNFIKNVLSTINIPQEDLIIISPDAGAFKKIFKLAEKIDFKGDIECASKSRNNEDGSIYQVLNRTDFNGKSVLIIDDITINSGTHIGLAKMLKERNSGDIYLAVSHTIAKTPNQNLKINFKKVFTTNSRHENFELDNIEVFNIF